MKIPPPPPDVSGFFKATSVDRLIKVMNLGRSESSGDYYHWDQLRHRNPPEDLTHEEWWAGIKLARSQAYRQIPFQDKHGKRFVFVMTDKMLELLHQLDSDSRGQIAIDEVITTPESRDRYVISSLIEEAITSSQLEGAATTRKVAVEMLRSGRKPRDESEQMIANNYRAMQHIRTLSGESLSHELVLELHRILAHDTLATPDAAGRLQRSGEKRVRVFDNRDGTTLHTPPPAEELPKRLGAMCAFANATLDSDHFVHPVIRAIILHFWLAYDHPFEDGNGRTARALFYWAMLKSKYWLFEFVSISSLLRRAPTKYSRAFLYTETDDNDLTYFLLHQLEIMRKSIDELYNYLKRKIHEVQELSMLLHNDDSFNYRQCALLAHALRHRNFAYTIESHRRSHNAAYATARSDLLDLAEKGLLAQTKIGRRLVFQVPENLHELIKRM